MKKISIGLYRWEIAGGILALSITALIFLALVPFTKAALVTITREQKNREVLRTAATLPQKIAIAEKNAAHLDSIVKELENRPRFEQTKVVEQVYALAEKAGCDAARVEIGDNITIENGKEVPFIFRGKGNYTAIGKFIEGIENLDLVSRIRQATIKKEYKTTGSLYLDFIVIDGNTHQKEIH